MNNYTATYSPEDNKLRLYCVYRLDAELYAKVKALGFKWAPKQDLFVAPAWNPEREDFLIELAGEIEAESMTLAERAAIKAERLEGYAQKRFNDSDRFARTARAISERFADGQPILIGHHSERKARKDQERSNNAMHNAVKANSTGNYWLYRATSLEHHVNRKQSDRTRANRIKTLLADLRDTQRTLNFAFKALRTWNKINALEDQAKTEATNRYSGAYTSEGGMSPHDMWSKLDKGEITTQEVIDASILMHERTLSSERLSRWIQHILNRLAYEQGEQGQTARFEGDLRPALIQIFIREQGGDKPTATKTETGFKVDCAAPLPVHIGEGLEIELSADEWKDLMRDCGHEVKDEPKAKNPNAQKAPPLINPTKEDAERLQALWNKQMFDAVAAKNDKYTVAKTAKLTEITQAVYSANSKGDYSAFETVEISADGVIVKTVWRNMERVRNAEPAFRVRISNRSYDSYKAPSLVMITDKPGKELPINWPVNQEAAA